MRSLRLISLSSTKRTRRPGFSPAFSSVFSSTGGAGSVVPFAPFVSLSVVGGSATGVLGGDRGVSGDRVSFGVEVGAKSCVAEVGVSVADGGPDRGEARSDIWRVTLGGCAVESRIVKLILSKQNSLCNIFASLCGPYLKRLATRKGNRGRFSYGC